MTILLVAALLPLFIISIFIPYWTRKTESFGVTIPEKTYNTENLKAMRKKYSIVMGLLSVITVIIFLLITTIFTENIVEILFTILIFVYIIGAFFIYLKFHRQMKTFKQSSNWAKEKSQLIVVNTSFRNEKLTYSHLWFIIPFVITLITIIVTFNGYDRIPHKIPMNYDLSGIVTNWTPKTYKSVLMIPMIQLFMTTLFLFINIMIAKAKQQISAENPNQSTIQNITFRRRWSGFIIGTGIAFITMFALIQGSLIFTLIHERIVFFTSLIVTFGTIIWAIVLSITTGQGGSRVKVTETKNGDVIDRDDDKYWKLGQFYVNKNDPAIFLEKRFGIGWTNNWAHPISWLLIIGIIALAIGIPLLLSM